MLWEKLVDTPVRGVVHEAAGPLAPGGAGPRSRGGAETAHETWRIPLETLETDPADHERGARVRGLPSAGLLGG